MKTTHRRKTFAFESNNLQAAKYPLRHHSIISCAQEDAGRIVVMDIIEYLLEKMHEEEKERSRFVAYVMKKLTALEVEDTLYFDLEDVDQSDVMCHQDEQPVAEENRTLEVVKNVSHLKKSSKRRVYEQNLDHSQVNESSRMSIIDPDKKDRDIIIQKLKREYSLILQSKYLSESTPIGESRSFFMEGDAPEIAYMRSNFGNGSNKKTLKKHKPSFVQQEIRRHHKLDTIFKKSRDYVETIDPTMSNSMYLSKVEPQTSSHSASVVNPPFLPQQPSIIVKLSKLKEVSNVINTKNQVVSQKNIPADIMSGNTKFANLIAEQERQSLKLRVERSFHSNNKMRFKEVSETERKPRMNNAISVSFLPKIARI